MQDYPHTLRDLEAAFRTEEACREYLARLRWPGSFLCPGCAGRKAWTSKRALWVCSTCGRQTSVTAGTIFQDTRLPLTVWFRAIWWVTSQKTGASALSLQKGLGLGSYRTAWALLQKLRRAMVRPGRDRLNGAVEVDETFVGGVEPGGGRRHIGKKALVAMAAEVRGPAIGRIRLRRIPDSSAESLLPFVEEALAPGSRVITDGLPSCLGLSDRGYRHRRKLILGDHEKATSLLPRVHRVASLLKRWLLGTHQGGVSREHLDYYLDEFTFRFNRRTSRHRGLLFHRLLENAMAVGPAPYETITKGIRGRSPRGHPQR
ncbi:MAG TPA: IS1595 family transposase [Candidatus Methylomirabilis sp.]|nr:IS1595 family transposase [Candidatus Methylomirabilis sp.]